MSAHAGLISDMLAPRIDRRQLALWSAAAVLVLVAHAGSAWLIHHWRPAPEPAGEAPPAVMIDLAPMAVAPEAVPMDMPQMVESAALTPVAEPVETAEPVTDTQPVAEPLDEAEPVEAAEQAEALPPLEPDTAQPVETEIMEAAEAAEIVPEETVTQAEEVIPDLVEAPLPEVALAVPEPRPIQEEPEPVATQVERKKPAEKKPVERKQVEAPAEKKPVKKAAAKPAPKESAAAQRSAQAAPKAAAPAAKRGAFGASVSPARWQSRVNAHLNRHKRFPKGSREQGTVGVRFSIDPSGQVLSASIARSSGSPELDSAAIDMVRRASPVPAPPPEIARARMNLTVPVRFSR